MAKVFMSVLGTNKYVEAKYVVDGKPSPLTPFVQEAFLSVTKDEWKSDDRIVIFLTDGARKKNWESGCYSYRGLRERLEKLELSSRILAIPFRDGKDEAEIMENFLTIVNQIQEGDEIIFDITHSFRSLPMLVLVALVYASTLKNAKIKKIYYGAFEVLGSPKHVEENIPPEQRKAPVFDLTVYANLVNWAFAVDEFSQYGMASRLSELMLSELIPVLRRTKGRNERARSLRKLTDYIKSLTVNIYTCRCIEIEETNLDPDILALDSKDFIPAFAPLADKIRKKVERFSGKDSWLKAMSAVEWCIEHNMIQQGYTILQEATISEVGRLFGVKDVCMNKSEREFISSLLSVIGQNKSVEHWEGKLKKEKEKALNWIDIGGEHLKELAKSFASLSQIRNDINHCGCRKDYMESKNILKRLEEKYQEISKRMQLLRQQLSKTRGQGDEGAD